ncbi:MAG: hypothetical protein Q9208_006298 [Pyrenodesmia sp. 3 TL-2023]
MGVNIGLGDAEHPDKGYQLFITALVMVTIAGLVVLGRLAARWANKAYGYDDYAIVVSLYFYIAQVVYKIVVGFTKISILILYLRIFTSKPFRLACYINLGIVAIFTIGSTIATILQCIPTKAAWDKTVVDATCINSAAFWYAFAVINIITDAIILFLPVRQVLRLHLDRREKIGLLALFSLGAFVTVSSVIRATAVANSTRNQSDITWNFIPRGIWTLIEANTGIICASLPMLHKPAAILFPCLLHRRSTTSSTSRYPKPSSRTPGGSSSYSMGGGRRGSSFRLGMKPHQPRTLPDGTPYQKQGSESRKELREKVEEEGGEHSLPLQDFHGRRQERGGGGIVRQVDVDITYQDHMGRAVTSDQRVQDAREAV